MPSDPRPIGALEARSGPLRCGRSLRSLIQRVHASGRAARSQHLRAGDRHDAVVTAIRWNGGRDRCEESRGEEGVYRDRNKAL